MTLNGKLWQITLLIVIFSGLLTPAFACDDTLVMLLTAKNPTSEFSKAIRNFTSNLTILGSSLKAGGKDSYDLEMNKVMDSWLEFSTRYMNNPPEEAKNDLKWTEKTSQTARAIGEIRRFTSEKKFLEAHNLVLELSSRIGTFFEAVGVSKEKQLFIKTSASLTMLEKHLQEVNIASAEAMLPDLSADLLAYKPILPDIASTSHVEATRLLSEMSAAVKTNLPATELGVILQKLKSSFEELRSHILMQEWFPAVTQH